ncbi:MAG TPA: ADP/ATP-dependent (S)-NAD(P)H-hydrate dehydratase, partial [Pirellulaceae bacterium]
MSGSIGLAGMAALRSGTGLVTVAIPEVCATIVAGFEPSYMTLPLPTGSFGTISREAAIIVRDASALRTSVAIGPGLGRAPDALEVALDLYQHHPGPLVVDADALFALALRRDVIETHAGPRILTPHAGEFRRLVGEPSLDIASLRRLAEDWAAGHNVTLVLKGHCTL